MTMTRMLACWLGFVLMFAPVLSAQENGSTSAKAREKELPDAPKPNLIINASPKLFLLPAPGYKGPMPSHGYYKDGDDIRPRFGFQQIADQRFWTLGVVLPAAASAFDAITTLHAASLGHPDANPLFGSHPTAGRVAAVKLGAGCLVSMATYFVKKEDMQNDYIGAKRDGFPPRWWVLALLSPALYIAAGAHNLTLGRVKPQM